MVIIIDNARACVHVARTRMRSIEIMMEQDAFELQSPERPHTGYSDSGSLSPANELFAAAGLDQRSAPCVRAHPRSQLGSGIWNTMATFELLFCSVS